MLTIAVVNSKGGVGKTTLSAALGVCASQEEGGKHRRVGIVDLDPQKSLVAWWKRRGKPQHEKGSPTILEGVDSAAEAVERARESGLFDLLILDGPPAFLTTLEEMISSADFTLIPVKPSIVDILASEDAVVLARDAGASFFCVFNDVGSKEKAVVKARSILFNSDVPIADIEIRHLAAHITGMNMGKSAAEVKNGEGAGGDIRKLWEEIKPLALKAAKTRTKTKAEAAHD